MKKVFSLVSIMALLLTSFATVNAKATESQEQNYTGQELFEGVFFGIGEVGNALSDFWEPALDGYTYSEEESKKIQYIEKQLEDYDSQFFIEFKEGIESGDQIVIEETIIETEKALADIFHKEIEQAISRQPISDEEAQSFSLKPGFALSIAYSYAGVTHIAGAFVLTYVAVGHKFIGPSSVEKKNLLTREMYVDSIAKDLN